MLLLEKNQCTSFTISIMHDFNYIYHTFYNLLCARIQFINIQV